MHQPDGRDKSEIQQTVAKALKRVDPLDEALLVKKTPNAKPEKTLKKAGKENFKGAEIRGG